MADNENTNKDANVPLSYLADADAARIQNWSQAPAPTGSEKPLSYLAAEDAARIQNWSQAQAPAVAQAPAGSDKPLSYLGAEDAARIQNWSQAPKAAVAQAPASSEKPKAHASGTAKAAVQAPAGSDKPLSYLAAEDAARIQNWSQAPAPAGSDKPLSYLAAEDAARIQNWSQAPAKPDAIFADSDKGTTSEKAPVSFASVKNIAMGISALAATNPLTASLAAPILATTALMPDKTATPETEFVGPPKLIPAEELAGPPASLAQPAASTSTAKTAVMGASALLATNPFTAPFAAPLMTAATVMGASAAKQEADQAAQKAAQAAQEDKLFASGNEAPAPAPGRVEIALEVPPQQVPSKNIYTIKDGDSLSNILASHPEYKDIPNNAIGYMMLREAIEKANGLEGKVADKKFGIALAPGTELVLPGADAVKNGLKEGGVTYAVAQAEIKEAYSPSTQIASEQNLKDKQGIGFA